MGFLGDKLSELTGSANAGATDPNAPHPGLLDNVMGLIGNAGADGLGGLVEKFKSAGLGGVVSSWIGTGQNQPVSPDQVQSALGEGQIGEWAKKLGIPADQVKTQLANFLPTVVDKLTPTGQLPENHGMLQGAIGLLKGKLFGG